MKKLLSLILVTVLCVLALASCDTVKGWFGQGEPSEPADEITYDLAGAVEFLRAMYINGATITPNDYEVVGQVMVAAVKYTVDWSVDNDQVKLVKGETKWTVDVDNFATEAHDYVLTATITAGDGTKDSVSFNRQVPKYEVLSYDEFLATEDDAAVTVSGVITGIVETSKENDLYIQDENGGYFIYNMEALPSELGLKIGMTVSVTGNRDTYYDLPQVANPVVTIMDSTIKTVAPIDITEEFAAAEANVDANFSQYFSMLVTLKGVKVLGQSTSNDSYFEFSLADKTSYVRISSSTCMLSADDTATFKNNVAANINNTADVVGLVANYSGKIYIVPVDVNAFSNFQEVTATAEEKVDYELNQLTFTSSISEDGAVNALVAGAFYNDVNISWVSDNACAVVDNTAGTITFTRLESAVTVKLTATVSLGDITKTKEFTVEVDGSVFDGTANLTADKLGLGAYADGEKRVEGINFGYTELGSYGDGIQMRIKDGKFSTLFNTTELPYGIKKIELVFAESKSTYDNAGAFKFSFGNDATVATYTTTLDTIKGTKTYTITPDVATYTYFKMELLLSYSFYWAEINIVLDMPVEEHTCEFSTATCTELAKCPICGATQGELAAHVYDDATHQCVCEKYDPEWLAIEEEMTIEQALAAPVGKKVKITGTVSEIKSAWSDQYKNMEAYLADEDGNSILLYRIKTLVEVGDALVINGVITAYKGVNQIDGSNSATTVTKLCKHENMSAATCEAPKTCPDCGAIEGEALGHDFGENKDAADCLRDTCDVKNPDIHVCDFVFAETVAPTCTAVGYDLYKCTDETCPLTEKRNEQAATGHQDTDGDYKCDVNCGANVLPEEGTTLTIEQALAIGALTSTTQKYYISGTITKFYTNGTTYGNFYIEDTNGKSILIYGLYKDGVRYDSMTVKPVIGDTVTVYGTINPYNGVGQFGSSSSKNELTNHVPHTCDYSVAATCTKGQSCAICGAVQEGSEPIAHSYSEATCLAKATCSVCGATTGEKADHVYDADGKCTTEGCTATEDAPLTEKTYSHTIEKQGLKDGDNTLSGVKWAFETDCTSTYIGWDGNASAKGLQFGKAADPAKHATFTSENFSNVSKIVVNTSGGSGIAATLVVKVGDTVVKTITLTTTATDYTIELSAPLSGPIVLEYTQTSAKALYIKSIAVTYAE